MKLSNFFLAPSLASLFLARQVNLTPLLWLPRWGQGGLGAGDNPATHAGGCHTALLPPCTLAAQADDCSDMGQGARSLPCQSIVTPPRSGEGGEQPKVPLSCPAPNLLSVNDALIIEHCLPPMNYGSVAVCSPRRR